MAFERKIITSVLRLTKDGPVANELVVQDANVPVRVADIMFNDFCDMGLIQRKDNTIEASSNQRVKLAIHAIKLGADLESVSRLLNWIEFENMAASAFEVNNFFTRKRFRFTWFQRKWEIDLLGCRDPLVICVDCKHWSRGWQESTIKKAVEAQSLRVKVLSEAIPSLRGETGLVQWRHVVLIPVVLSLVPSPIKFYNKVPVVPIIQLQNFLDELWSHVTTLNHFSICF